MCVYGVSGSVFKVLSARKVCDGRSGKESQVEGKERETRGIKRGKGMLMNLM